MIKRFNKQFNLIREHRFTHGANLAAVFLIFVVLACSCPNSQVDKHTNVSPTPNVNSNSIAATNRTPSSAASPTPTVKDLDSPEIQSLTAKGRQIYQRIESRDKLPIMFGWQANDITLLIPTGEWSKMTKADQVNLTYYAQSLVSDIRENPVPMVDRWSAYYKKTEHLERGGEFDGLDRTSYMLKAKKLCDSCWKITIGKVKGDGFYDEEVPVEGHSVQSFREGQK